jgi:perosamine synthetase
MFGIPAPISNVNDSIKVIEDCAQSLGALVDGVPAGTVGELGVFSFYATKVITAGGQGGMVVSKNKDYIEFIKDYRNFDCRRDTKTRFNFQLTDLQAAVARTQLSQLPQFLRRRAEIFQAYTDAKLNLLGIGATGAVRYRAVFKTAIPQQLIQALAKDSIGAIVPIEKYELLSDAPDFRNAIILCNSTVSLPIYPLLEETSVQKIVERCCAL